RLNDESRRQAVDVTMHRPKRPDRLELTASIEGGAGRFTQGLLTVEVGADLAALEDAHPRRPQVTVAVTHPRVRGQITLALDSSNPNEWTTSIAATAHGRGILRPVVALAGPIAQVFVRRYAARMAKEFAADIQELNDTMASEFGTPASPDRIAEQ